MEEKIVKHEEKMLNVYSKIIREKYQSFFSKYGCALKIGLEWEFMYKNFYSYTRPPFGVGYSCVVYCEIQKEGKLLNIPSYDGEVDYYPLFATWEISVVNFPFNRLPYVLFPNIDEDMDEDMNELAELLIEEVERSKEVL